MTTVGGCVLDSVSALQACLHPSLPVTVVTMSPGHDVLRVRPTDLEGAMTLVRVVSELGLKVRQCDVAALSPDHGHELPVLDTRDLQRHDGPQLELHQVGLSILR